MQSKDNLSSLLAKVRKQVQKSGIKQEEITELVKEARKANKKISALNNFLFEFVTLCHELKMGDR